MKAQIIKEAKSWHWRWPSMWSFVRTYHKNSSPDTCWEETVAWAEHAERELETKGRFSWSGVEEAPVRESLEGLLGHVLDDGDINGLVRHHNRQRRRLQKQGKAQGGNLRAVGKAMEIADKWPDAVRIAIIGKLQKTYSHVPTTPRPERSTTRQRAPRSHRVAVSVRGGDSGDDDSGESDPPVPPLSRYGCPYLSVTCNPQPITIVSVDLISRVPMADGHFAWTFGGV